MGNRGKIKDKTTAAAAKERWGGGKGGRGRGKKERDSGNHAQIDRTKKIVMKETRYLEQP